MVTDPYDDDDDQPTLQRPPSSSAPRHSSGVVRAAAALEELPVAGAPVALEEILDSQFLEEASTDTDLAPLGGSMAGAGTVPPPPHYAEEVAEGPEYTDLETPKIPLDVAAVLLRASLHDDDDDGGGKR